MNGKVERSEFYQLPSYKDDVDLEDKLGEWENFCNFNRPHCAFNGKTPYERSESGYTCAWLVSRQFVELTCKWRALRLVSRAIEPRQKLSRCTIVYCVAQFVVLYRMESRLFLVGAGDAR